MYSFENLLMDVNEKLIEMKIKPIDDRYLEKFLSLFSIDIVLENVDLISFCVKAYDIGLSDGIYLYNSALAVLQNEILQQNPVNKNMLN